MDKKRKKIIIFVSILLVIIILAVVIYMVQKDKTKEKNEVGQNQEKNNTEQTNTVEELMQEVNSTADPDIYEVATEYDGREVLSVKTSMQFSVAFAGKINENIKNIDEAQKITQEKLPLSNGIYLGNKDNEILEYINKYTNCKYSVSDTGFLQIQENNEKNEFDNRIQTVMQSNNLYIIYCDGEIKIIDNINGEIRKL